MFENILENLNESSSQDIWNNILKEDNISLDEEVDSLLDEEFDRNDMKRFSESISFDKEDLIKLDEDIEHVCNTNSNINAINQRNLSETLIFKKSGLIQTNMDKFLDEDGNNIYHKEHLFNEELVNKHYDLGMTLEESFIFNEAPKNKTEFIFDKDIAGVNVKKLLEEKNPKMKKLGYVPLNMSNFELKNKIEELKTQGGYNVVKALKVNGVIVLNYFIHGKMDKKGGVCYYNEEKRKLRVFNVVIGIKKKKD